MHLRSPGRPLAWFAAAAFAGATLTIAPAASAAPVFVDASTNLDPSANAGTFDPGAGTVCTVSPTGGSEPDVPVVENGPAASASTTISATYAEDNDPTDTGTASGSANATGKVTSSGGVLRTMDFSATSNFTLNTPADSDCYRYGSAGVDLEFRFTVSQPGFLTLEMKNRGTSYGEVYLFQSTPTPSDDEPYVDSYGQGLKANFDTRVFLPAGTYEGYFGASSGASDTSGTRSGTTTVHGDFAVAGSQTEAVDGKGKKYVKFPTTRNCAAHTLTPTITDKGKRAEKIQSVKFFVNGHNVKKVTDPAKGEAVSLTIADDEDADVRALVKLEKVKKGVPAKKFEVTSSYIACA